MEWLSDEEVDVLRSIADRMRAGNGEPVYGFFPGGDPREFTPDAECCTGAEMEAHAAACKRWDDGDPADIPGGCRMMTGREPPFGLGVYEVKDPGVDKLASELDEWIDAVRQTEDMYR